MAQSQDHPDPRGLTIMSTIERAMAVVEDIQPIIDHVADTEIDA